MNARPPDDRNSSTQAIFQVGRDPELERLLRMRLASVVVLWALGAAWQWFGLVRFPLLHAASLASLVATAVALWGLRTQPRHSSRVAELHVAADLFVMPAFTLATGAWESPFIAILVVKPVSSALLVGRGRGAIYGTSTLVAAVLLWIADAVSWGGVGLDTLGPPLLTGLVLGILGAVLLQAASLPMDAYRDRRKLLVSENRRLEEAIGELEVQNQRLTALHELSGAIGTLGSMTELVGKLRDAVQTTFPGRQASFFFYRRETGRLDPIALAPGLDAARAGAISAPDGELHRAMGGTLSGDTTPPGGAIRVGRDSEGQKLDPSAVSQVTVPLLLGGKPVGLLVLESRSPYPFDEDDRQLLVTIGNEMAVALRNAELNTRSKQLWEFQQSLIENANALILVVDANGVLEVANRAFINLIEPGADPVGNPVAELVAAHSADDLRRALADAMNGTPVENLRLDFRCKDGEKRSVFNLAPVRDRAKKAGAGAREDSGRVNLSNVSGTVYRHVIAVGQDITRVELLEREIAHSEKLASLGTFVAGIAHEMNNPLTAITAYGDYLRRASRKGETPADTADKLDNIVYAGERIQGFVQSLLGFARPASSVQNDVDVNRVIKDSLRLCQYDIGKAAVDVQVELAAELPPVSGIEAELQQVFINLFTNAAHASPAAGGLLRIVSERDEKGVRVRVVDNGHGIPADVLPRIFEAFYSTKEEGKGSGLGLSIVKRIIDQHSGRLTVESEVGKGTTFVLEIPHAASRPSAEAPSRPKVGAGGS